MTHTVLQIGSISDYIDPKLAQTFRLLKWWEQPQPDALLAAEGANITGIATNAPVGVPPALFDRLPALKVISSRGVGLDKIDLARAQARGIQVAGSFGVLNGCVADLAMALLLDTARRVAAADRYVRSGQWAQRRYPLTTRVHGKKLGIVGLGQIGTLIARRAAGFDMEIAYTSRHARIDAPYRYFESVPALARWCDFLVVVVPGGADTRHLISREVLDALGPEGTLVNIARGSVVDEAALTEALVDRRIAGAGLDVYEHEPHVPDALLALDNVVLSPHAGSATRETRTAMDDLVVDNLRAYYEHGKVLTPATA
ncbi:MAG: 2-hydroxyacid dehydrogenase [Candidimonas sp.]|nr:MAG: 2-hydroxyacid dehydrogenase [Candidimonas sp.]